MTNVTQTHQEQSNMKVLIFGATGATGRDVMKLALDLGYAVTAFVRNRAKVDLDHPALTVVQGDVMDLTSVERAVPGHDAVLCSLGDGMTGKVRSTGTQNIIRAMQKTGVRRLICQSTIGAGDSQGNLNFYWKYVMFGILLRRALADTHLQEQYIRQSRLDWTIVRPGSLTDSGRTGTYRHGFPNNDKTTALKISTADVADFMLKQLIDDTYLHATPGLSY